MGVNCVSPVVPIVYLVVSGPKCVCVCTYLTSLVCSVLWLRCTNFWGSVGLEVWGGCYPVCWNSQLLPSQSKK